jgi:hypothetical protein
MLVDVVIVDAQSDLNVYTEAARQTRDGKGDTTASNEPVGIGCCCGVPPPADGKIATSWDLADIDLNQWAGKFVLLEDCSR